MNLGGFEYALHDGNTRFFIFPFFNIDMGGLKSGCRHPYGCREARGRIDTRNCTESCIIFYVTATHFWYKIHKMQHCKGSTGNPVENATVIVREEQLPIGTWEGKQSTTGLLHLHRGIIYVVLSTKN
jgi:hypothetical protein